MSYPISESRYAILNLDRAKYEGEVLNNQPHGYGVWTNEKGKIYTGSWKEGKKEGLGSYKAHDKFYRGPFVAGKPNGFGTIKYDNGDRYEGAVLKGLPHGQGIFTYKNGDTYSGNFENGQRSGYGIMDWKNIGSYKGLWIKDCPATRTEKVSWPIESPFSFRELLSGYIKTISVVLSYVEGTTHHSEYHITYCNKVDYKGEYDKGMPNGKGALECPPNISFKGLFKDGLPLNGKVVWKMIGEYDGAFVNGAPAVKCLF